jgi:DinB superfamily
MIIFIKNFKLYTMNSILEITRTSRKMIAPFIENYTLEQLNTIPAGFSNNLIWNIAHVVVTQQLLVYKLSGLTMNVSDEMVEKYKKGTKPEQDATQAEVDEIKALLSQTIDQTAVDLDNKIFENFTEYPTSTGFILKSAKDAMAFNNFHEGLHIGILMSIRKFI